MSRAEVAERIRAWEASHRAEQLELLGGVDFPIYAAAGRAAMLTGHGGSSARLGGPLTRMESVTVAHGAARRNDVPELKIETAIAERARHQSESTLAREALQRWLYVGYDNSPPQSDAAFVLGLRGREHERRKRVAVAQVTERVIQIDGSPQPFQYSEVNGRWAAVRRTDALTITVTGRAADADALTLMPVADPSVDLLSEDTD
jgi:hypothetical protein